METFINKITDSLCLSSIALCELSDGVNNYLVLANGSNLNFYQYNFDIPTFVFQYKLFANISTLIPYKDEGTQLLIVITSCRSYFVLHYEKGKIEFDQKGDLDFSEGSILCDRIFYSIHKSLLLIQCYQETLALYRTKKRKLIFIQLFTFNTSIIYKFKLISSNQFAVLCDRLGYSNSYEIHNFDLFSHEIKHQFGIPIDIKNFAKFGDRDILISNDKMIEIKGGKFENLIKFGQSFDIFDIAYLNEDLFLAVTFGGRIFLISPSHERVEQVGEVVKPFPMIMAGKGKILISSAFDETKLFVMDGDKFSFKTLFSFPGYIRKFLNLSKRSILGLTPTNNAILIENTMTLNDIYQCQFDSDFRCWFLNEKEVLFSNEITSKVLNIFDQNEVGDPIIQDVQTIGFRVLGEKNYIQVTQDTVFIGGEAKERQFSNISLPAFYENSFAFCENSTQIFIYSNEGNCIFHHEFPFQVNSFALCNNQILAISSIVETSVFIFKINLSEKENDDENSIELLHKFPELSIVDLLFIDNDKDICALSPNDLVYFLNSSDFSVDYIRLKGVFYKLVPISRCEILISGSNTYLIKDKVSTEVFDAQPFLHADCYEDLLLFCSVDGTMSVKRRDKVYHFRSKILQTPFNLIDFVKLEKNVFSIVLKNDERENVIAVTDNVLDFKRYKFHLPEFFDKKSKFLNIISVSDSSFNYSVCCFDSKIISFYYSSENIFIHKSTFEFNSKPVGLVNIEKYVFCLVLIDCVFVLNLEDGNFNKISYFETLGGSNCFSYLNKKLMIGSIISTYVVYEYDENYIFSEICRLGKEIFGKACAFINDDLALLLDESSYLYQAELTKVRNFATNDLTIKKACCLSSNFKNLLFCNDLNSALFCNASGQLFEVKEINCPFDKNVFDRLYTGIEENLVSLGNLKHSYYRKLVVSRFFIGIPRIYDTDLLLIFLNLNENQKMKILTQVEIDLDDAEFICHSAIDSI